MKVEKYEQDDRDILNDLTKSASLLAGICKFKKKNEHQVGGEDEKTIQVEEERLKLLDETLKLTQKSFINSLNLEEKTIKSIQSNLENDQEKLELTPLESLTLQTQDQIQIQNVENFIPFNHHLIFSQLQIKQKSLNQWIKCTLDFDSDFRSPSETEFQLENSNSIVKSRDHNASTDVSKDQIDDDDQSDDDDWNGLDQLSSDPELESNSSESDQDQLNLSYTTTLNDADMNTSDQSSTITTSSSSSSDSVPIKINKSKTTKSSKFNKKLNHSSTLNQDGFFNLAEFESEVNQGENEMRKKLGKFNPKKQKSVGQDSDDDQDDLEDVDLFAPYRTGPMDDDADNDEQNSSNFINLDATADLRYDDFFVPPKVKNSQLSSEKSENSKKKKRVSRYELKENDKSAKSDDQNDSSKASRVRFLAKVAVQEIPAKNRGLRFSQVFGLQDEGEEEEEDDDDDDYDDDFQNESESDQESNSSDSELTSSEEIEQSNEEEDFETKTMKRIDSELFDDGFSSNQDSDGTGTDRSSIDDEDKKESSKNVSRHAQKMKILSQEISKLEAENVAKKDWMLKGEASSKDRPQNSLLEQDLEFEHVQKIAPAITEEKTLTIESLIKQRILEGNYDDVVRKRLIDPKAFLPSRLIELSDTQPTQSLTEMYEESYKNNKKESETGVKPKDVRDEKLEKEHLEIKEMFESLSNKLDGLSNAHFTPPEPKVKIKTINNLPTVSLESNLPTATGAGTLLAPEEIFNVKNFKNIVQDSDSLTHSQKQNLRTQIKKSKKKQNSHFIKPNTPDINSKSDHNKNSNRLSVKDQKRASLDQLKKMSSSLNSNTSITLINKRDLSVNNLNSSSGQSKHRKLADGSSFKL